MSKAETHKHHLYTLYALAAVDEAVKDAGLQLEAPDRYSIGVIWGADDGGVSAFEEQYADYL